MDIKRLNSLKFKIALYLIPFLIMLCACINFIFFIAEILPVSTFIVFVAFHLLFLISLSAVCGNMTIEIFMTVFEDVKNSSLRSLIYGGKSFLPIRYAVFVLAFTVGYIMLAQLLPYRGSLFVLMLVIPPFAILFNAPRFLSGRVRLIDGCCLFYKKGFHKILSYHTDERGTLIFVTEEGNPVDTGVITTDIDPKTLSTELQHLAVSMTRIRS